MPFNVSCPKCQKTLKVPDEAAGKRVRCPNCQEIVAVSAAAAETSTTAAPPAPLPTVVSSAPGSKKKAAAWDTDDEEKEEAKEERPVKTTKKPSNDADAFNFTDPVDDDDEDEDRRRRKRKRRRRDDDDDDDDYDDYRGRGRRAELPHRGSTVLLLGIFSMVLCCAPIIGLSLGMGAINMANTDLAQMASGRMDPSGRGTTQTGRALGTIGCVLSGIMLIVVIILTVANGGRR